jgi:hypothetical protein
LTYQDWETKWFKGRRLPDPRSIYDEAVAVYKSMQDTDKDENGKPLNAFGEILKVSNTELLIRFRHRLQKVGRKRMVEILTDEIEEREALEAKQARETSRV